MPRAPKICSAQGCPRLIHDGGSKCLEEHRVAWANKGPDKRRMDTKEHRSFKQVILDRCGRRCQVRYFGCDEVATQVDRIDNKLGYTLKNCQGICRSCHIFKSSDEGHEALGHAVRSRPTLGMGSDDSSEW